MTNEKMLELLNDFMKYGGVNVNAWFKLEELKNGLTENIRLEVEKAKGTKPKDVTVMKKIWKDVESGFKNRENYIGYHPFTFKEKEYNGFTDGHFIVATSENNYGYKKAEERLNMKSFFDEENFHKNDKNIELKIDIKDIKLFKKTHKKSDKEPYIIENDDITIGFNPYYLENVLNFCESDIIYVTDYKSPAYIVNEDETKLGLVLPVNLKYYKKNK